MGGIGSGRRGQVGAGTTEDYCTLDVRWLRRKGVLGSKGNHRIIWSRGDEVRNAIGVQSKHGRLILNYRVRESDGQSQARSYPVNLDTTPCHIGGSRQWFLCPAIGCGRRVAILYGGVFFACRDCHGLVYPSQREKPAERAVRKADRIRDRMDWPGGILEGSNWGKPKGMHWNTFVRLRREHDALANYALAELM